MFCARLLGASSRQIQHSALTALRRYTTARANPPISPSLKAPRPPTVLRRPSLAERVDVHRVQKLALAEKLFDKGVTRLYSAPRRRLASYRFHAYALGSVFIILAGTFAFNGYVDPQEYRRRGTPKWVYYTFMGITMAFVAGSGMAVNAAAGHIKALDLVKKSGQVFLKLSITRVAPFMKPRSQIVPLYDFKVKYKVLGQSLPDYDPMRKSVKIDVKNDSASAFVSKFFYSIFSGAKQFILREGMFQVEVHQPQLGQKPKRTRYYMDILGEYERLSDKDRTEAVFAVTTLIDPNGEEI